MIFQCACQDFPYWRIIVPQSSQKSQLFSPPVESPHSNLITYTVFSITKDQIVKTIPHAIFFPLPVKTLPQAKFPTPL